MALACYHCMLKNASFGDLMLAAKGMARISKDRRLQDVVEEYEKSAMPIRQQQTGEDAMMMMMDQEDYGGASQEEGDQMAADEDHDNDEDGDEEAWKSPFTPIAKKEFRERIWSDRATNHMLRCCSAGSASSSILIYR